jgi:hypothetical protein
MANYSSLISAINAAIKQNGNQEITGPVLNSVLNAMVSSLGNGWQFGGVVTPASNPGSPDAKLFYLAWTPGTYTGFGNKVLEENKLGIFTKTGSTVTLDTVNLGGGPGTYVVTGLELLEPTSATSEQIDEAIGGFDNLVAAIQSGAVVLSADTTDYQHSYKVAVAELGDTGGGLASISILNQSRQELNRYNIQKASPGSLSMRLYTTSLKPINNVYTVRMKGLKNASNSNEIIAAIGSWPQLFAALSSNKVIMEAPAEGEPYGSLYVCYIVAGSLTSGAIQLTTLDSSTGTIALKTYTVSATAGAQLSVTVESISYVTSTDARVTYQTITDSSLQTQDKTVPGAINEVNAGLEEVVKPYVINLTALLAAQDSESISAAVGGIDNLNGTVQKNQVIFGTLANGTVAVGIRVLGNQTTLTYFVDSVVGLTVNEVIITNTSGTLTKTVNTHAVLTENMVVDNLESDEATLPLSAAQGKALSEEVKSTYQKINDSTLSTTAKTVVGAINELKSSVDTNTGNVTRIDRAVGKPTVNAIVPTAIRTNFSINTKGIINRVDGYNIYSPIDVNKGDTIVLYSTASKNISIITSIEPGSESGNLKVINALLLGGRADYRYAWTAPEDMTVVLSSGKYGSELFKDVFLIKSSQGVNLADNSYMQYLHKVYEEYGAVYNAETGYWELNGLTDLTEEDMWNIYNASLTAFNSFSYNGITLVGLRGNNIFRTLMDKYPPSFYGANKQYVSAFAAFQGCSNMETLCVGREGSGLQLYGPFPSMFNSCFKLRVLKYLNFSNLSAPRDGYEFKACKALKEVRIVKICTDLNFSMSPLIDYESWKYMIENAKGKSAITVTVHPTTYSYLTGTAQPTEEVGGTTEEWQALVTTAQGKQISFAQPAETLEVEPLE